MERWDGAKAPRLPPLSSSILGSYPGPGLLVLPEEFCFRLNGRRLPRWEEGGLCLGRAKLCSTLTAGGFAF